MKFINKNKDKKEELSPMEKRNRAAIILAVYAVFFIFLFIFLINSNNKSEKQNNNPITKTNASERLKNYTYKDNYEYEYNINNDLLLNGQVYKDKTLIIKTYNNKTEEYLLNKNNYFKKINNQYEKINNINIYEKYEDTFTDINNVITLLDSQESSTIKENNNITTETFYLDLNDYLKIYNDLNLTNYVDSNKTKIENSIEYNSQYIIVKLDMTELYKIIDTNTKQQIIYTFKIYNVGEVNDIEI